MMKTKDIFLLNDKVMSLEPIKLIKVNWALKRIRDGLPKILEAQREFIQTLKSERLLALETELNDLRKTAVNDTDLTEKYAKWVNAVEYRALNEAFVKSTEYTEYLELESDYEPYKLLITAGELTPFKNELTQDQLDALQLIVPEYEEIFESLLNP